MPEQQDEDVIIYTTVGIDEPPELGGWFTDRDPGPCQPIGCDNGIHVPGCPFEAIDADEAVARVVTQ